jgi:hypothetical protein
MNEKKYEEIGTNYRFFLGWRHATFAGDVVVLYGVVSLTLSIYQYSPSVAWIVPATAFPIGILLWIIDVRTRTLYHAAAKAGKDLEGDQGGFYTQLSKELLPPGSSSFKKLTHSMALDLLFWGTSVIMGAASIALFLVTH